MAWRKAVELPGRVQVPGAVWIGVNLLVITDPARPYAKLCAVAFATEEIAREHMPSILGVANKKPQTPIATREFTIDGQLLGQFMVANQPAGSAYEVNSKLIRDAIVATADVSTGNMLLTNPPQPEMRNFFHGCAEFAL